MSATYTDPIPMRGDMLASVGSYRQSSNPGQPGFAMELYDVEALGGASDSYRLVWYQNVNSTATEFQNGQMWRLEAYSAADDPDGDPNTGEAGWSAVPGYERLVPAHDIVGGLGGGDEYIVLRGSGGYLLYDLNGNLPEDPSHMTYSAEDENGDPDQGDNDGELDFEDMINAAVPCFVPGTRIATPAGARPVETLRPGDLVSTLDHGPQPLAFVVARGVELDRSNAHMAPVRIAAGSLGDGLPLNDLICSPQHRLLHAGAARQCLVAAKAQLSRPGVRRAPARGSVDYFNLAFAQHEIVFAEGIAVESFFPGREAMKGVSPIDVIRLCALYPTAPRHARHFGKCGKWARRVAARPKAFRPLGMAAAGAASAPLAAAAVPCVEA
ncbi:Hint domain-containing protein [Pseudodonghicola flavimaris]|uniref:Hint domain-containing protein n=1 Tax=Pseudodonghicola flavimaris TaxID=3050036 RepID=A0ABT7F154_9RHOB|nr:Hint domain-containing protein [Pseudodonghicola flavimaris]MDK3018341.1 Hint domain-containing protein [Pseudodonghicola flavimaris]